jgi:hypothetical protein
VHQMIVDTPGQDLLLSATVHATHPGCKKCDDDAMMPQLARGLNVLAAKSKGGGKTVVVRVVNSGTSAVNATFDFVAGAQPATYTVTTLASTTGTTEGPGTDNPVWAPLKHVPVESESATFAPTTPLTLPPVSFQIFVFTMP